MTLQRCLLALLLTMTGLPSGSLALPGAADESTWSDFKMAYGRVYGSLEEERLRRGVFFDNLDHISRHNDEFEAGRSSFWLGVNQFTDITNEEFRKAYIFQNTKSRSTEMATGSRGPNRRAAAPQLRPSHFDWRDQGVPIIIKNQGLGIGWAYPVAAAAETGCNIATGLNISLSRQNLFDCVHSGTVADGMRYVRDHGVASEADYFTTGGVGECRESVPPTAAAAQAHVVTSGDEGTLAEALRKNPVAVTIDAGHLSFQLYSGGVYDELECSVTWTSHAQLLVGYGADNGTQFWSLADSWGPTWGERASCGSGGESTDAAWPRTLHTLSASTCSDCVASHAACPLDIHLL